MSFKDATIDYINETPVRTENGMKARATSASAVLDFFGKAGSARGTALTKEFTAALVDDEDLAIRALLWTRDIRGGAGERKQFRDLLASLEATNPALAGKIMHKIPELGRWDDLFVYRDPINRAAALRLYADALINGDQLAAKWSPREKSTKSAIARELREFMKMSPREYRKMLSGLTTVVENQMCAKEWNAINFSHVPSLASARYQKAFGRNASEPYAAYLRELQKPQAERDPKVKINAAAVYPYDVVRSVSKGNAAVADEQWKALPNYVGDARILPMVDVSGSMGSIGYSYGSGPAPIEVAVSLGIYLSEKNTSDFKDMFLTFSGSPKMEVLQGSLSQRISQLSRAHWEMNTNLHAAFDEILKIAKRGNVPAADMPDMMLILSDMQFDHCTRFDDSAQEMIRRKYEEAGYEMPKIVFWNLNASYGRDNTPIRYDDRGVCHVSGFSPAIMKSVLANDIENFTPYNVMLKTLLDERYNY